MTYAYFNQWVSLFANEVKVIEFRKLAEACAFHIMDPAGMPAPSLDYRDELPEGLDPNKLLEIYEKLWSL